MSAMATVLTPFDRSPAIELSNTWRKRILPVGSISYQGRTLNFTRSYLQGLVAAWQQRAYDSVPFQLADAANTHSNDPERTRGRITGMELADDGLWITAELTERGQQVLSENPYLGVSARIVEQYQRADGEYFPAAIQHVLGTLDPRIPGLGAWQPIDMANDGGSAVVIDLSSYSFAGAEHDAPAGILGTLTDAELGELLDVMDEVGLLDGDGDYGTGAAMYDQDYADAAASFDAAFTARAQADADRADARAAAAVEDLLHPAHRDEDRMRRIMNRAASGVYDGAQADFTAEQGAVDIMLSNGGRGTCGAPDEFGRCSARWHDLECSHQVSVDWLASGPPASTGQAALANFEAAIELAGNGSGSVREALGLGAAASQAAALSTHQRKVYRSMRSRGLPHGTALAFARTAPAPTGPPPAFTESAGAIGLSVWGDPDDLDEPWQPVPQATVELAAALSHDWGLADAGFGGGLDHGDPLYPPAGPVSMYDALAEGAGEYQLVHARPEQPGYPGISDLARQLGLK